MPGHLLYELPEIAQRRAGADGKPDARAGGDFGAPAVGGSVTYACAHARAAPDADGKPRADSHGEANADPCADSASGRAIGCHADTDTYAYAYAYANAHTDADTHADADTCPDTDADANTHADADTNTGYRELVAICLKRNAL